MNNITFVECKELTLDAPDPEDAAIKLFGLLEGTIDPEEFKRAREYEKRCLNNPDGYWMILVAADEIMGTYGVESIDVGDTYIDYCNTGDSYCATVVYCKEKGFCFSDVVSFQEALERELIDKLEPQYKALAQHLECNALDIEEEQGNSYVSKTEPGTYTVLTDADADEMFDEQIDDLLDEMLAEHSTWINNYFDRDSYKRDVKMGDGRGPTLAHYDGAENEEEVDGTYYFIYRTD